MMITNYIKSKVVPKDNPQLDLAIAKEILKETPSLDEQKRLLKENELKVSEANHDTKRPE